MKNEKVESEKLVEVVEIAADENLTAEERSKIDEYQQQVAVQKSKKKKNWNLLLFLFNIVIIAAIILYQVFGTSEFTSLGQLNINFSYLLLAFVLFGVLLVLDCLPIAYLVRKACNRRRFGVSFKSSIWGRYYDSITPMAAGGEAFQVTYLMSYDVPATSALSIPVARLFFLQFSCFIMSSICLIMSFFNPGLNAFVSVASYIGFVLSFAVLFTTFFLAVSKNTGRKIVVKVLKLLQKMKIVKDYEKQYKKTMKYIEDYQNVMIQYMKSPKDFCVMFFLIGFRTFMVYSVPFMVYLIFGAPLGISLDVFSSIFVKAVLIELAASFMPLPGGTGMSEISFSAMFESLFGGSVVWAMLLYRFFTFYIYLLLGLFLTFYDFLYGKRKYKWLKVERALQAESKEFKQVQIDNFRLERATRRKKQTKEN